MSAKQNKFHFFFLIQRDDRIVVNRKQQRQTLLGIGRQTVDKFFRHDDKKNFKVLADRFVFHHLPCKNCNKTSPAYKVGFQVDFTFDCSFDTVISNAGTTQRTIHDFLLKTFYGQINEKEKNIVSLPKIIKSVFIKMKSIGNILRELRETKQLPLRVIAAFLDIDPAIMSRIERGQRKASREQVVKLAEYFNVDENELLVAWLSDKVVYELAYEQNAIEALKVAEDKIKYNITQKI